MSVSASIPYLDFVTPSLAWPVQFCAFAIATTYVASILTGNVSQVDRLWTFLPTIYTAYYALLPLFPQKQLFFLLPWTPKELGWTVATQYSPRALLMFGLVFIWMCRLTYNTYRRGLFNPKEEDYRWQVLRSAVPTVLFQIVNIGFISGVQNILLMWLGLPTRNAAKQSHASLTSSDYGLCALALTLLALEFTADNQQYAFHSFKHAYLAKKKQANSTETAYKPTDHWIGSRLSWKPEDAERGFVTRGLWRYSRHPNFACEQGFWWVIAFFPLLGPGAPNLPSQHDLPPLRTIAISLWEPELRKPLFDTLATALSPAAYGLLPAIALSTLFFASTTFTEFISEKKYPKGFQAYKKRVAMFAPTGTIFKAIKLRLLASSEEAREVQRLIWGPVEVRDKIE